MGSVREQQGGRAMSKWFAILVGLGFGAVALVRYRTMKETERQLDYQISRIMPLALAFALDANAKKGGSNSVAQPGRTTT
jgi:hypothetical protein